MTQGRAGTVERGFVTANGVRLHYLDWGGPGRAVLLLHGLMGDAHSWEGVAGYLSGRFRCVALDQRGHGRSDRPASRYAPRDYAADVRDAVRELGLERPHVVGHSMGGRTALAYAALYPDSLDRLVLVDIGPEAWRENYRETVRLVERTPEWFEGEQPFFEWLPERARARAPEILRRMRWEGGRLTWGWDRHAVLETVRIGRGRGWWGYLRRVRAPTLLVRGERSRELRPTVAQRMLEILGERGSMVVIPDCGHDVPRQAPHALATALDLFLSK